MSRYVIHCAWALGLAAISGTALASCRLVESGVPVHATLGLRASQITVGRDLPLGSEVFRQELDPGAALSFNCSAANDIRFTHHLSGGLTALSGVVSRPAGTVYATEVAGIGVRFLDAQNRDFSPLGSNLHCPGAGACTLPAQPSLKLTLSFIKTSDYVGAGSISGAGLPGVDIDYESEGQSLPLRRVRISGQLRVVSHTCRTPNVLVNLGRHTLGEFQREGYSAWRNFDIVLEQCPGFHGYYSAGATLAVPGGLFKSNRIAFRIDPTQRAFSNEQGILSLTSQMIGAVETAQGVGVQIADENNQPIRLSTRIDSGIQTRPREGGSYSIPFKARYIRQPGVPLRSGPANATATFTIDYQ